MDTTEWEIITPDQARKGDRVRVVFEGDFLGKSPNAYLIRSDKKAPVEDWLNLGYATEIHRKRAPEPVTVDSAMEVVQAYIEASDLSHGPLLELRDRYDRERGQ